MSRIVRVPRSTLLRFRELIHQGVYTNANPLVRWIFWRRLTVLLEFAEGVRRRRALDFGCAEGVFLPSLAGAFDEVAAVDLDVAAASAIARHYGLHNVSVVNARAPDLPFAPGSFDFIVAADVLEHLPDLEPVVAELTRLLAPGGKLVVSAPSENFLYEVGRKVFGFTKPIDHYHVPKTIERALRRHLDVVEKRYLPVDLFEGISAFVLLALGKRAAVPA